MVPHANPPHYLERHVFITVTCLVVICQIVGVSLPVSENLQQLVLKQLAFRTLR